MPSTGPTPLAWEHVPLDSVGLLDQEDPAEPADGHLGTLAEAEHLGTVFRDTGDVLLAIRETHLRARRHDDAGLRTGNTGSPGALGACHSAAFELALPDVPLPVRAYQATLSSLSAPFSETACGRRAR